MPGSRSTTPAGHASPLTWPVPRLGSGPLCRRWNRAPLTANGRFLDARDRTKASDLAHESPALLSAASAFGGGSPTKIISRVPRGWGK